MVFVFRSRQVMTLEVNGDPSRTHALDYLDLQNFPT